VRGGSECGACKHPDRASIELGLANSVPLRVLAKRFGLSTYAIHRHRHRHMTPQLLAQLVTRGRMSEIDLEKLRITESEGLLHHLVAARGRLYKAMDEAEARSDFQNLARVTGTLLKNLELTAKLLGELNSGAANVTVNILALPEYHGLRTALMQALKVHPEARAAVLDALHRFEAPNLQAIAEEPRLVGPSTRS